MSLVSIKAYAKAAHFGPSMLITAISFVLATRLWWEGPAYVIALTVFLGQLIIGWSNDIYDYSDDLKHNRINKPLITGTLTVHQLRRVTFILTPIAVIANLLGPLGLKGGSVYLLGVACGIAYNFYFKFSPLSPLPYAIACAALPASIFYATNRTPPLWVLAAGSMLGVAFHFANVLKDLKADKESQIGGLPQRMGRVASSLAAIVLVIATVLLFITSPVARDLSSIELQESSSFILGGDRPVTVVLPTQYLKQNPAPLLINLHGYSGDSTSQSRFTFLDKAAQERGVIYVAPDGLQDSKGNRFWSAFAACCNFNSNPVDDAAYIKSLIDQISKRVSVDSARIYLFGHSNGHFMSYKFACTYPQSIAAIAGLAGAMDSDAQSCQANEPMSVLHIHGTSDDVISYGGGEIFGRSYTDAVTTAKRWALIDKCSQMPAVEIGFDLVTSIQGAETIPTVYSCPEKSVELWQVMGGVHSPELDASFALKVMDWLLAHPKK
ncbi:MAG: UbiA family prenyltransferase [Actinomycetota bacterium]|nr:UbiA family prenyltransferase [Actinomycetota bacterium]